MQLVFDIETDSLSPTEIHCIVAIDEKDKQYTFDIIDGTIDEGISFLSKADKLIGHNIIGFDIPVIKSIYPWFNPVGTIVDTLILSRLYHPDLFDIDKKRKYKYMLQQMYGRHSLEAWGYRLGEYKGSFSKTTDWKEWSQDMEDYCIQDVVVTKKLCDHFHPYLSGSR